MGGASAIAITTDKNSGGCSIQDVVSTVREQATALNDFPSPLPVIVRDLMVDEFQIALAKVRASVPSSLAQAQSGLYEQVPAYAICHIQARASQQSLKAAGVTINVGLVGPDRTKELLTFTTALGMEGILQVTSEEEIKWAVDAGAAIIAVTGQTTLRTAANAYTDSSLHLLITAHSFVQPLEACELKKFIPDDIIAAVHVDRRSIEYSQFTLSVTVLLRTTTTGAAVAAGAAVHDYQAAQHSAHFVEWLEEIEDCWVLRDAGYNCIWASEMLYKAGQLQAESVIAVVKCIRAKASVKYGRARGMSGKGEGAKEFLGTLAT
eukprot:6810-Heterococcus_DN1.PRE.2